ncbi:SDR family NAD(P)-dependent oxidoreductase [Gammaproteobacteria bacterium]|jgi:NAD(P)-dependent dehydrogenase (short-subunit alcohol dehydrogenase family)|nr:SDR family NAD(P)-dependent oxidoreductase [Pseudomonadota bacterium]MDA9027612.1 SDR family NAD(P)-dependent oxidoreductase [Gammaproteobacteria bacterium]MDO7561500.1 SDR family NAD(P)-dependent oxidoreductase [SAR86 cluster bacterium]MDA9917574.1 SDR family NAD(P)-dependent oxidoreductase [Gammaproteobacteria bacterium]MDB9967343.1 SDR family NAD(P)-dependent oxidoreductase [Gammaproteobacteria bacterium]
MKDLNNKVAVITGAGSGIGRGIAEHAAKAGMCLVLADINEKGLNETLAMVKSCGVEAISRVTDVSSLDEVENLASQTYETFQNCHLLFNNAGVLGPASLSEVNREMYDWLININLGGCFNGIHAFLPRMKASGEESHIIATCSTSGFIAYPMLGLYSASKFGIRGLMTSLRSELAMSNSNIGVSIVCPGEVTTNIVNSTFQSNEPAENKPVADIDPTAMLEVAAEDAQNTYPISPLEAAQGIFAGIENKEFYIFTHKGYKRQLEDISSEYLEAFNRAMFQ